MKWTWLKATLVCGTLDILYAIGGTLLADGNVMAMLRFIASGPLGDRALRWGEQGAAAGLAVHFALMGIMVAILQRALRLRELTRYPAWLTGLLYGVGLYLVMYAIVMPIRFGTGFPPATLASLANGLVPHVFLVGIPMALILRRKGRGRR